MMSEFPKKSESYHISGIKDGSGKNGCMFYLFLLGLAVITAAAIILYQMVSIPKNTAKGLVEALRGETKITEKIATEFSKITGRQDLLLCTENETLSDFKTIERTVATITSKAYFAVRVPVEYNYLIPLNERQNWSFECKSGTLEITAPAIKFLDPNIKWLDSEQFIYGGVLIDSNKAMDEMKEKLSTIAKRNATRKANSETIRQAARMSIAKFFNEWLSGKIRREYQLQNIAIKFKGEPDFPAVKFVLPSVPQTPITFPSPAVKEKVVGQ